MLTFDGKSDKFKLFEDLFQTSLRNPKWTYGRKKYILLPLSHAWCCIRNIQKHHQPQQREYGNHIIATEQPLGNQTRNKPVQFLSCSNICPADVQESEKHTLTTFTGYTTTPPLTITTSLTEEKLMRDEQTNGLYLPLTATVVLKRKQEMLYVRLDSENNLTIDALVDSRAYVSAFAQNELDTIKKRPGWCSQNRWPSQILNKNSKWPAGETVSNTIT